MQLLILAITISLILLAQPTQQQAQDLDNAMPADNNSVYEMSCLTARSEKGLCVERQACDYGTPHIDRTLYAPKGYKKTCKMHEVCCPVGSINRQPNPPPETNDDKELKFDDEDKD